MDLDRAATLLGTTRVRAASRLVALGYTDVCGRCCGSGRYSWNQMDGDRCYGCGGSGKKLIKLTTTLIAEAKARIEAGELAGYFAMGAARGKIKGAAARATKVWSESLAATTYSRVCDEYGYGKVGVNAPAACFAIRLVNAIWKAIKDVERDAHGTTDPIAALAKIEELEALLKVVDAEFRAYATGAWADERGVIVVEGY